VPIALVSDAALDCQVVLGNADDFLPGASVSFMRVPWNGR
jgi:hypothetical protein